MTKKLEKLLSLMQSNDDDHLVEPSSLDHMNLTIHQDFLIKVLEKTELHMYYHVDLVNVFKWVWSQHSLHLTTLVLQSLVFKICGNFRLCLRDKDIYSLWDSVKEIAEKQSGLLNVTILNKLIITFSYMKKEQ